MIGWPLGRKIDGGLEKTRYARESSAARATERRVARQEPSAISNVNKTAIAEHKGSRKCILCIACV